MSGRPPSAPGTGARRRRATSRPSRTSRPIRRMSSGHPATPAETPRARRRHVSGSAAPRSSRNGRRSADTPRRRCRSRTEILAPVGRGAICTRSLTWIVDSTARPATWRVPSSVTTPTQRPPDRSAPRRAGRRRPRRRPVRSPPPAPAPARPSRRVERPAAALAPEDDRVGQRAGTGRVDRLPGLKRHPEHERLDVADSRTPGGRRPMRSSPRAGASAPPRTAVEHLIEARAQADRREPLAVEDVLDRVVLGQQRRYAAASARE